MKRIISVLGIISLILTGVVSAEEQVSLWVNGSVVQTPGLLKDDRTFVPIRFVAEELDAEVLWNEEENAVYIYDKPDEIIPLDVWYGDDFEEMMQTAFEELGLDYGNVYEKNHIRSRYLDENIGLLTKTGQGLGNKLIIEFYGEGTRKNPYASICTLWYFDLETHEFGKICDNCVYSNYYDNQKYSLVYPYNDYEGNLHLFDMATCERWSIPQAEAVAVLDHTVYYTKNDDELYVHNLYTGEEKVYPFEIERDEICKSYSDGEKIYMLVDYSERKVIAIDPETIEISHCEYDDTEFDFYKKYKRKGLSELENNTAGVPQIYVDDMPVKNIPDAFILNDRTYVPIRFVAEALGAEVKWIDGENRVDISGNKTRPARYAFTDYNAGEIGKYN